MVRKYNDLQWINNFSRSLQGHASSTLLPVCLYLSPFFFFSFFWPAQIWTKGGYQPKTAGALGQKAVKLPCKPGCTGSIPLGDSTLISNIDHLEVHELGCQQLAGCILLGWGFWRWSRIKRSGIYCLIQCQHARLVAVLWQYWQGQGCAATCMSLF